jgi:LPS-assembly protein
VSLAAHAEPSSCPQQALAGSLPPLSAQPDGNLVIHADHGTLEQSGISTLKGAVLLQQGPYTFAADSVRYDDATHTIFSEAQSLFRDADLLIVKSQRAQYNLDTDFGDFQSTEFSLPRQSGRGEAQTLEVQQQKVLILEHSRYTGCPVGREDWVLQSSWLRLDNATGLGTAHNALLKFFHVPVFYMPWFRFPIDNKRRTGFLMPTFGQNQSDGTDIRIPFYVNLAPNYDLLLAPRYMSKRGTQINGDARYLFEHSEGRLHGEYLGQDQQTHTERSFVDYSQQTRLGEHVAFDAHYASVSDVDYFSDLGGKFDSVFTPYLERTAQLTYQAPALYTLRALVQDYQPLAGSENDLNLYQRVPALFLTARTKNAWRGLGAGIASDFSNFSRSGAVEGQRLYADPYLRWEQDHSGWFASLRADLTYTAYNLTGPLDGAPSAPRRTLPEYSFDSGLRFDRLTSGGQLQTLEPRLFYLYVPYRDQSTLPLFDTGEPDFDFPQLFATNRFSGEDRISDASQLTTVVTSRLLDAQRGIPILTASAGQIYRFLAPRVALPGETPPDRGSSDYIGDVEYALSRKWSAASLVLWSPDSGRFDRSEISLRYLGRGTRFQTSYRFLRATTTQTGAYDQTDTSFSVPVVDGWRLASRVRYSLRDHELLDAFGGIQYETCCWALQTTFRRNLLSADGRYNNGIYFQIELKGLSHIGTSFESLMPPLD